MSSVGVENPNDAFHITDKLWGSKMKLVCPIHFLGLSVAVTTLSSFSYILSCFDETNSVDKDLNTSFLMGSDQVRWQSSVVRASEVVTGTGTTFSTHHNKTALKCWDPESHTKRPSSHVTSHSFITAKMTATYQDEILRVTWFFVELNMLFFIIIS